jgi:hypothetical protein
MGEHIANLLNLAFRVPRMDTVTGTVKMDISRRVIGASAVVSAEGKVIDVDLSGLIRRLLLFDKYVLVSVRLGEFPVLARSIGYERLRDLLAANLIEIRCECLQLGQMGQSGMFDDPRLPPFSYKFNWIDAHDKEQYVHQCLHDLHGTPGLRNKQVIKLKGAIAGAIRPLPPDLRSQLFPPFQNELLNNNRLVKAAVEMEIQRKLHVGGVPFSVAVHQEGEDIFRAETDLHHRARVSEAEASRIIEVALLAVAGLSQRIGEMKAYSALSGFRDEELPLFRHKLGFLADAVSTQSKERDFQRVMEIAGLPEFSTDDSAIDVDKLLKIRESSETREFRDWLGGIGQADEKEIRERVNGFRVKVGMAVGGKAGKLIRFLVTNAVGLIPGQQIHSLILNALDQFLLDKLLPRSGVAAFVHELYPSIFENSEAAPTPPKHLTAAR